MLINNSPNTCPVPNGILVIVGGKEDKDPYISDDDSDKEPLEILKAFIKLIEKENPLVEVVTTASSVGDESFQDYKKVFEELNVTNVGHIHHDTRKEVLDSDLTERLNNADAFFFSGGDQLKLTSIYGGTYFLTILKDRYISGGLIIGGTSAGAMALSTPMIYAGNQEVQQITGEIKITTGLEFLKDVCIDTHFIDRSRFVRMAQVIATNPTCIGIGIEENTAIIVREGSKTEVIGTGIITIIEGFFISASNITKFSEAQSVSIREIKVHLLSKGEQYDIPQMNPPHK